MHETIIKGCKHNDPVQQRALFGQFAPLLMTVARRYTQNSHEAEDLLQEAFVKIFRSFVQFDPEKGSLEGWMRRIVVNTCLSHWRQQQRELVFVSEDSAIDQPVAPQIDQALDAEQIMSMIAALPPGFRLIFNLYAIDGFSHAEIAGQLGISESTARSQLARARKHLQSSILVCDERF
jgi:RNA polymerase sigma factor (sigma-70 family)